MGVESPELLAEDGADLSDRTVCGQGCAHRRKQVLRAAGNLANGFDRAGGQGLVALGSHLPRPRASGSWR